MGLFFGALPRKQHESLWPQVRNTFSVNIAVGLHHLGI